MEPTRPPKPKDRKRIAKRRPDVYVAPMASRSKNNPGQVRDAILSVLSEAGESLSIAEIVAGVRRRVGETPASSVRSYLRLNTPRLFVREQRGLYRIHRSSPSPRQKGSAPIEQPQEAIRFGQAELHHADCFSWLERQAPNRVHGVVTDPPYGLHEYTDEQQRKLRSGKGGVWRLPPSFDGHRRSPLPRFTTLNGEQLIEIEEFFSAWGKILLPVLVPGANVVVASNPLVSHIVATALASAGLERRGEIMRLTMTMRGGDRPKGAHEEFNEVSVMPRSMWEPWLVFRKPLEGRVQDNLRKWGTGGFRRPAPNKPFGDVIASSPTRRSERNLAPHPSLKPQAFLRQLVRGVLALGEGMVLDPFAGAGSTLAACNAIGYRSLGVEKDKDYFLLAKEALPKLTHYAGNGTESAR